MSTNSCFCIGKPNVVAMSLVLISRARDRSAISSFNFCTFLYMFSRIFSCVSFSWINAVIWSRCALITFCKTFWLYTWFYWIEDTLPISLWACAWALKFPSPVAAICLSSLWHCCCAVLSFFSRP